jgi:hypothetical protein
MANQKQTEEFDDSFLDIDELSLEKEWVIQPKLCRTWLVKLAKARKRLDNAKLDLEFTSCAIEKDIRSNPKKYKLIKVTEGAIEKEIPLQPSYQNALREVNEAKNKVSMIEATTTAIEHKKRALENLVELFLNDYYAEPKARPGKRDQTEEMFMDRIAKRSSKNGGRKNE